MSKLTAALVIVGAVAFGALTMFDGTSLAEDAIAHAHALEAAVSSFEESRSEIATESDPSEWSSQALGTGGDFFLKNICTYSFTSLRW